MKGGVGGYISCIYSKKISAIEKISLKGRWGSWKGSGDKFHVIILKKSVLLKIISTKGR